MIEYPLYSEHLVSTHNFSSTFFIFEENLESLVHQQFLQKKQFKKILNQLEFQGFLHPLALLTQMLSMIYIDMTTHFFKTCTDVKFVKM